MSVFEPFDSYEDIDDIVEKLDSDDPKIRQVAVMSLAETADIEVIPHIVGALSDISVDVRLQAARVLENFDGAAVSAGLAGALQDPSSEVSEAAALSLAELKEAEAAIPLLPLT